MSRNRFTFEYDGTLADGISIRDNPHYFSCLQVSKVVAVHDGCVNTVCWDDTGESLLTGSDDRRICITPILSEFGQTPCGTPVFSQKLPAESNIFVAKFLPQTSSSQIIVGFKCGCVLHVQTGTHQSSNVVPVHSHKHAVYDVLTFPEFPTCFSTLSHDQNVIFFDTRQPFGFNRTRSACSYQCAYPNRFASTKAAGFARMQFKFPVTAGDVHPLHGSRCVALGCADGFVRLFDLRRFTSSGVSPVGEKGQPMPFLQTRPLGLPARLSNDRSVRLDYGPARITSVQFEPIYSAVARRLNFSSHRVSGDQRPGFGGRRILISHMYAPIFLFDITKTESAGEPNTQTINWLPDSRSSDEPDHSGSESEPNNASSAPRNRMDFDPAIQIALAFSCWIARQRTRRRVAGDEQPNSATPRDEDTSGPEERAEADVNNDSDEADESSSNIGHRLTPFELLTEEYVTGVLQAAPRARQVAEYSGRRSCRTVLKSAVFWGRDHILSGSECGHVIGWNRWSGDPVVSVKGDETVVNRITPHPILPMFACCGIDHTVKIIEPDPRVYESEDDGDSIKCDRFISSTKQTTSELCQQNVRRMVDSLQAGSLHLERLASFSTRRVLRTILQRLVSMNRSSDDSPTTEHSTS